MNNNERKAYIGCWYSLVAGIILMMMVALSMCSCTKTEYITVEKVRNDTTYVNKLQRDSVWLHDSTFVKVAGDTVWIERWHTKWQNHLEYDTIYRSRVDSVPVPYHVIKEVERKLTKTEKGLMMIGVLALLALFLFGVYKVKRFLPGL